MTFVDKVIKQGIEYPIKDGYDKTAELEVIDGIAQMTDKSYQCVEIESDVTIYFPDELVSKMATLAILNTTENDLTVNFSFSSDKTYSYKRKIEPDFTIINMYAIGYQVKLDLAYGTLKDIEEGTV